MRFAENPFSNPFGSSQRFDDGASRPMQAQAQPMAAMPAGPVQAQALPPVQSQPLPQPSRMASAPTPIAPAASSGGWSAAGGTQITVGSGESLNTISQRYGVPAKAILAASGLSSPSQVVPGRRVVIPVYRASGASRVAAAPAPAAPAAPPAEPKFRLVENKKVANAPAEPMERPKHLLRPAGAEPVAPARVAAAPAAPLVSAPRPVEPQKVAAVAEPQPVKPVAAPQAVAPAPQPQPVAKKDTAKEPEQTASVDPAGDFRWPARGRIIAGFGANGGNEGINIAVPEGTPVKAAEAGVVTYAGSEVKGYGNLVLVRHENGYVSAYAHNGSLNVKRGDRVNRGQVIATSGQTGNVTSPQLHFEIRKGATPMDPIKYLGS